jgi:subtilisin family serine protease
MSPAGHEFTFHSGGRLRRLALRDADEVTGRHAARRRGTGRGAHPAAEAANTLAADAAALLRSAAVADRRPARFLDGPSFVAAAPDAATLVIPTETFVVEGGKSAVLQKLRRDHGVEVVAEGRHGKMLLRVPGDTHDRVRTAFALARETWSSGAVQAAHPNFVRATLHPQPRPATVATQWNLHNDGAVGVAGADVRARQAWSVTRGSADVLVAVLDEGVDALHPDLAPAVRAERDFVDGRSHAHPEPRDAHGTAVAGIIASRSERWPGLAPGVGLLSARIARGDGAGHWIADDFDIADAIDWAWASGAHVLTLAWGGGPAVDLIDHAIERARRRGRRGKGTVVVAAAGNEEAAVQYPAHLDGVLAVGASNQWDERKTRRSRDGEADWGSNYGPSLDLLAPGVAITTTDNRGLTGYTAAEYTPGFNGTSAAAPHAAAAAALVLSLAPRLREDEVRRALCAGADHIPGQRGRTPHYGDGRLNAFAALRHAKRR